MTYYLAVLSSTSEAFDLSLVSFRVPPPPSNSSLRHKKVVFLCQKLVEAQWLSPPICIPKVPVSRTACFLQINAKQQAYLKTGKMPSTLIIHYHVLFCLYRQTHRQADR